jgi:hypothetical protein
MLVISPVPPLIYASTSCELPQSFSMIKVVKPMLLIKSSARRALISMNSWVPCVSSPRPTMLALPTICLSEMRSESEPPGSVVCKGIAFFCIQRTTGSELGVCICAGAVCVHAVKTITTKSKSSRETRQELDLSINILYSSSLYVVTKCDSVCSIS